MNYIYKISLIISLLKITVHTFDKGCFKLNNLQLFERKIYSQNGEDGILLEIINSIGFKSRDYLEFGVENGLECNSRVLREKYNFTGVMFDGGFENHSIGLYKEYVNANNILSLFKKYNISKNLDVLSIDIDMFDWWVLSIILSSGLYKPRIIVVEVNPTLGLSTGKFVPEEFAFVNSQPRVVIHPNMTSQTHWDLTRYSGANPLAFKYLADSFGYSLIYCENMGVNCFLILKSEIPENCLFRDYLPHISSPRYGTFGLNYPGHKVDFLYRKNLLLDNVFMDKIVHNSYSIKDIELRLQNPIYTSINDFFSIICHENGFNEFEVKAESYSRSFFNTSLFVNNSNQLSIKYLEMAIDHLKSSENIDIAVSFLKTAYDFDGTNYFSLRLLKFLEVINKLYEPSNVISYLNISGYFSHSGKLVNRTQITDLCFDFDRNDEYLCASLFISKTSCLELLNLYKNSVFENVLDKSDDAKYFLSSRLPHLNSINSDFFPSLSNIECSNVLALSKALENINNICEKKSLERNIFIFGPPGPDKRYLINILSKILYEVTPPTLYHDIEAMDRKVYCTLHHHRFDDKYCDQRFDSYYSMIKELYLFRRSINSTFLIIATETILHTISVWRDVLNERSTFFIFSNSVPKIALSYISIKENVSFETASLYWMEYYNDSFELMDTLPYETIIIDYDGEKIAEHNILLKLIEFISVKSNLHINDLKNKISQADETINCSLSSHHNCLFGSEGLESIDLSLVHTSSWVNDCYSNLFDDKVPLLEKKCV